MNKRRGYVIAAVAVLVLLGLSYGLLVRYRAVGRMVAVKKEELAKFGSLANEYLEKKASVDMMARRARLNSGSAVTEIERIGSRAGVRELIKSLKPLEQKQTAGYIEKGLEVRIERIDLNHLVSLLYLIENNRGLFVIRAFSMKNRFEDPDLLDVDMKIVQLVALPS
ncbi:MAG: hypothetical protein ACE5GY_03295 [Thermodesulfobacteriota bacterium]